MTAFLGQAFAQLFARQWWWLALVLFLLATLTNAVIIGEAQIIEDGGAGTAPSPLFLIAAIVRVVGLLMLAVALTRVAVDSPRAPFMPDAAFWLSLVAFVLTFAVSALVRLALPFADASIEGFAASNALSAVILAPLAPWFVALAADRPLALDPRPWLRRFGAWLPHLIVGQLLVVTTLGVLHAHIDVGLVEGTIARSPWIEALDGLLSVFLLLAGIALNVTAYRRVAKG